MKPYGGVKCALCAREGEAGVKKRHDEDCAALRGGGGVKRRRVEI
jgi:hypothetical protein